MPIYAFHCKQCGHEFERLQSLSAADPDTCPVCAAHAVQRKLSAPHFRLAGSGWYETDFKGKDEKKHNLAGAQAGPASDSSAGTSPPPASTGAPSIPAASGDAVH